MSPLAVRVGAGVLALLGLIALRGKRWAYLAFVVLGLLYFPAQTPAAPTSRAVVPPRGVFPPPPPPPPGPPRRVVPPPPDFSPGPEPVAPAAEMAPTHEVAPKKAIAARQAVVQRLQAMRGRLR